MPVVPVSLAGVKARGARAACCALRPGARARDAARADARPQGLTAGRGGGAGRAGAADGGRRRGVPAQDAPREAARAAAGRCCRGPAGAARASPRPRRCKRASTRILDRPAFAAGVLGHRGAQPAHGPRALRAQRGEEPQARLDPEARHDRGRARRARSRRRGCARRSRRPAASTRCGRILGDVYLVGRGDPNLSGRFRQGRVTARSRSWPTRCAPAGVRRIEGRLVGHEGALRRRRGAARTGRWEDLVWCYGAEVSALSFNDNCAELSRRAGRARGRPGASWTAPRVVLLPRRLDRDHRRRRRRAGATSRCERARLERDPALAAACPLGGRALGRARVALEDPARYAATVFARGAGRPAGIPVAGAVATSSQPLPAGLRVLAAHESPPLPRSLKAVNKPSQNLHAEMLLRAAGRAREGRGQRRQAGREARGRLPAARQRVRPDELVAAGRLRALALRHPHAARDGRPAGGDGPPSARARPSARALPSPGVDGTLANRMRGTRRRGPRPAPRPARCAHVNALAGYATTRGGERLAFVDRAQPPHAPRAARRRGRASTRSRAALVRVSDGALDIAIAPELRRGACAWACSCSTGVPCARRDEALAGARSRRYGPRAAAALRWRRAAREVPGAADARALYKALGLDPTKTRPSSEALLRRVLKGEAALPRQHAGGRAEPLLAARPAPVRPLRPRPRGASGACCAAARPGEAYEGIRKAAGERGRPARCWSTRAGAVRQPQLRLGADHDHARRRGAPW